MRAGVGFAASSVAAALRASARARNAARSLERRASCRAVSSSGRGVVDSCDSREDASRVSPSDRSFPPLRCYYSDWAVVTLPDKHRFPMDKYRATRALLEEDLSLKGRVEMVRSPLANLEDVLLVHDREYVRRVRTMTLSEKEARAIGFPMQNPEQVTRSLASTGGTIAATHDVMRGYVEADASMEASLESDASAKNKGRDGKAYGRVAAQIAGGTHHAFADKGEGFCVFNDIACAATVALATYGDVLLQNSRTPILIIDLDVHQGNGTAKIFENESKVVTFSMHGAGNYPWKTKEKSDHDVDLPDNTDDAAYLSHLHAWLPYLFRTYNPQLVFFQAGVDALKEDSFGRLAMTRAGMLRRNHAVYDFCAERDVPLVITMGGGYSVPFDASVKAHADVFRSAAYRFSSSFPASRKKKTSPENLEREARAFGDA
jgi:acetoin utilization deacetylase AcuC-like enzyme